MRPFWSPHRCSPVHAATSSESAYNTTKPYGLSQSIPPERRNSKRAAGCRAQINQRFGSGFLHALREHGRPRACLSQCRKGRRNGVSLVDEPTSGWSRRFRASADAALVIVGSSVRLKEFQPNSSEIHDGHCCGDGPPPPDSWRRYGGPLIYHSYTIRWGTTSGQPRLPSWRSRAGVPAHPADTPVRSRGGIDVFELKSVYDGVPPANAIGETHGA